MADKMKIEDVLKKLERMVSVIDQEIAAYETAKEDFDDATYYGDDTTASQAAMDAAKDKMLRRIEAIDRIIFEESEGKVTESLGIKGSDDITVNDLNARIAEVLQRVESVKALGIKAKDGNEIRTDTADTMARLEELDSSKPTRDYTKIDAEIAALEAVAIDEELFNKFNEIKGKISARDGVALDDVEVATVYKAEIADIEKKLVGYKTLAALKGFDTKQFSKIRLLDTFTNSANKPKAEQWFNLLKAARGDQEVTIGGDTFKISTLKDAEAFFAKFKGLSEKEFKAAITSLEAVSRVSDDELKTKTDEVKSTVSSSLTMELFAEDKAKIEAILGTNPVDVAKLTTLLKDMKNPDKENFAALEKLSGDPAEIARARKELDNLRRIQAGIKKEEAVNAEKPVAKEIGKFKIGKTEIELKKDEYDGNFVDLKTREDYNDVVEATYAGLSIASIKQLNAMVEKESKATGDRLPMHIPFFSKLVAQFRADKMTTRERAIAARVKGKIKTGIKSEQKASQQSAETLHERDVADATQAKDDLFRVDQETIDRIDAAARKFIIDQRGKTTVEQARNEAGRDEEK